MFLSAGFVDAMVVGCDAEDGTARADLRMMVVARQGYLDVHKRRCVNHQHCHRVIQHSEIIVAINMNIVLVHTGGRENQTTTAMARFPWMVVVCDGGEETGPIPLSTWLELFSGYSMV